MLKKLKKIKTWKRISFTLMVGFAVISFWRGVWELLDIYLFPSNYELSLWASLIIGIIILLGADHLTKELM
jgi:hypothetical protein